MNGSRPVRSVRRRTEASGDERFSVLQTIAKCGTLIPRCTPTPQVPTSSLGLHDRTVTRSLTYDMNFALRPAGCPAAERNVLTEPTGGALSVLAPVGADSPRAQLCQPGRAVVLKRRRKVRDEILGRDGKPLQSPSRKGRRQTLNSGLVQPQVDARFQNESLASVSRASSTTSFTKNWNYSVRFGVRPLDFRDHIARPYSGSGKKKGRKGVRTFWGRTAK